MLDALGYRLFFVFSAPGVRALYAVPEHEASFGLATFELVMKRKLPLELAMGRRNRPHDLFKNPDVESYLEHLEAAMQLEMEELGPRGRFEAFAEAKRLGYRLGLASWAGAEAASPRFLPALISAFERLDTADSFVRPLSTAWSMATRKRREWRAMREIEAVFHTILEERRASGRRPGDFLDQIEASFAELPLPERDVQVARDVMLIQMGAQSNLFAALAWTLVNLLLHPGAARARARPATTTCSSARRTSRSGSRSARSRCAACCARSSSRPRRASTGSRPACSSPPCSRSTTRSAAPGPRPLRPGSLPRPPPRGRGRPAGARAGLDLRARPARLPGAALLDLRDPHRACAACSNATSSTPRFERAEPRARQIGGVARAARPCLVSYTARRS